MTAQAIVFFNSYKKKAFDGHFLMASDTITLALLTNTYVPSYAHNVLADITATAGALATGGGYAAQTVVLSNSNWLTSGTTTDFKLNNITWNAVGTSLSARYLLIYKAGAVSAGGETVTAPLIGLVDLVGSSANITASAGQSIAIAFTGTSVFTVL